MAFDAFPEQVRATHSGRKPEVYARADGYIAVPLSLAGPREGDAFELPGAGLVVRPAGPEEPDAAATAVYQSEDGGLAVPTGRLFVQLAEGEQAAQRESDFNAAGFVVDQVPGYAPHAAWLSPRDGDPASGLRGIGALRAVAGVTAVEPEMLRPRMHRSP